MTPQIVGRNREAEHGRTRRAGYAYVCFVCASFAGILAALLNRLQMALGAGSFHGNTELIGVVHPRCFISFVTQIANCVWHHCRAKHLISYLNNRTTPKEFMRLQHFRPLTVVCLPTLAYLLLLANLCWP